MIDSKFKDLFDIEKFSTSGVGFDRLLSDMSKNLSCSHKTLGFPPYNIVKLDEDKYRIEMAVAGFGKNEIDISTKGNELVISGNAESNSDSPNYVHKGIATRNFNHTFKIADNVVVKNADMLNGMLRVWMDYVIPEDKKPRKIEINDPDEETVTDSSLLVESDSNKK